MLIGIMSDSHDNLVNIKKAVDKFNELGVDLVIHLGDICSPFSAKVLQGLRSEIIGVFGNNDGEVLGINRVVNGKFYKPPHLFEIENKKFILFHEGDICQYISEEIDFVLYGHSHKALVEYKGKQIIINPGAVSGYLSERATVVILNTVEKVCDILEIEVDSL